MFSIFANMFSGTIGIAVRVLEAILRENEATGSRKVFKYLLGLQDTILSPKLLDKVPKSKKSKNAVFYRIFPYRLYILFGVSRWDHYNPQFRKRLPVAPAIGSQK